MIDESFDARLTGRRILITGGASGIGFETGRLFARHGARVALLDRDVTVVEKASDIGGIGVTADISEKAQIDNGVAEAAQRLGGLDGLVNCAGIFVPGLAAEGDLASWQLTLTVNLTGPFLVTAAALPHLKAVQSATIVNVSSGIGLRPSPNQGAYAASKAGLLAWTKVLAQEVGPNIRVNATCPGPTDTPLMRANAGGSVQALGAGRALARAGEAREQADAILFLTGPESSFITGVTIPVDGGRTYY